MSKRFALSLRWAAHTRALAKVTWCRIALVAVLALSAFLNLFRLTSEGYGNLYYAATVKNMLASYLRTKTSAAPAHSRKRGCSVIR